MDGSPGRILAAIGSTVAVTVGALSAVQSVGYWALTAINGEPTRMMFIDHAGPAVTSGLIAVVTLGIGIAGFIALSRTRSATS